MHVLHPADQCWKGSGGGGEPATERRRDPTGLRTVLSNFGLGLRGSERSGKRSLQTLSVVSRIEAIRGCGDATEGDLSRASSVNMDIAAEQKINDDLLRPLKRTSIWFFLLVVFLGSIILAGFGAWMYQLWNGIAVAGIRWPIFWAFY